LVFCQKINILITKTLITFDLLGLFSRLKKFYTCFDFTNLFYGIRRFGCCFFSSGGGAYTTLLWP